MTHTDEIGVGDVPPSDPTNRGRRWLRPPARVFHLALIPPALGLLWSFSVPGLSFFLWLSSLGLLLMGAFVWGVRLIGFVWARHRGFVQGRALWFIIAPAAGILVLLLILTGAPLRARWAISRADFQTVVDQAMGDEDYSSSGRRIGLYNITRVYRQDEAVIFYEQTGAILGDAGFAYLRDGPFPGLEHGGFERPQFRHLGGPWYAWIASW